MILSSLNKDQRLYVIRSGAGYSCYGFDVLNKKAIAARNWYFEQNPQAIEQIPARVGTKKHFAACNKVIAQVARYCQHKRIECPVELTPQLNGLVGRRVEVVDCHGERRRFIVGRSTGWMPCHLEIARKDSYSGIPVSGAPFRSVSIVG